MKQPLKTSISAHIHEVAVTPNGEIFALVEIKYKAFQFGKPDKKIQHYLNISQIIKKSD